MMMKTMKTMNPMKDLTLNEMLDHLKENGGHIEGRGDGSIRWIADQEEESECN